MRGLRCVRLQLRLSASRRPRADHARRTAVAELFCVTPQLVALRAPASHCSSSQGICTAREPCHLSVRSPRGPDPHARRSAETTLHLESTMAAFPSSPLGVLSCSRGSAAAMSCGSMVAARTLPRIWRLRSAGRVERAISGIFHELRPVGRPRVRLQRRPFTGTALPCPSPSDAVRACAAGHRPRRSAKPHWHAAARNPSVSASGRLLGRRCS